jgi:threonine dehydratase
MTDRSRIAAAARTITPFIRTTPVMELSAREAASLGAPGGLTLKLELLQHAGSFKPRGAFNRILSAAPAAGSAVVAASGGNHGAAVAYAASQLGLRADIFVPDLSSAAKRSRIEGFGATLHVGGATYNEAQTAAEAFVAAQGGLMVHAYDMVETIAGQGTCGLEFERQAPSLDTVLVATGGGGFIAGIAAWYAGAARVVSVEPDSCPCLHAARAAGQPVDAAVGGVAADSLGARRLGWLAWEVVRHHVAEAVLVPDSAIKDAQRLLWDRFRVMAEPGGATALAALLCGAYRPAATERLGVLVCGANVDPASVTG